MEEICDPDSGMKNKKCILFLFWVMGLIHTIGAIGMTFSTHLIFDDTFGENGTPLWRVVALVMAFLSIFFNMFPITIVVTGNLFLFLLLILADLYENFSLKLQKPIDYKEDFKRYK